MHAWHGPRNVRVKKRYLAVRRCVMATQSRDSRDSRFACFCKLVHNASLGFTKIKSDFNRTLLNCVC